MSECWRFYAVPTARVIFRRKQVLTYLVLGENKFVCRLHVLYVCTISFIIHLFFIDYLSSNSK